MKRYLHVAIILAALSLAMKASGAVDYIHDDGRPNLHLGVGGSGGDLLVLNRFVSDPNGNGIETVSINWTGIASNFPATIVVYEDPNDDGDLSDLILLTEMDVFTDNTGTNGVNSRRFTDYIIPNTLVSGDFYVGAYVENMSGSDYPFGYDTNNPIADTSYFFENTTAADMFLADPNGTSNLSGKAEDFVTAGNFMIRANGVATPVPPVPEPSTALLAATGLFLLRRRSRKN